ncbi:hypothetical protein [Cryobacterium sp. N19]|uniref:hypothetical protein n=1 Tax=Cryobacterium sp. N19 TaxID=2048288 RepID=UPI000CE2C5D3|nr:hypothetical protein [Cryobacterium sp. N19]
MSRWPTQIRFASGGIGGIDALASAVDQCAFPEWLVELDDDRDGIIPWAISRAAAKGFNVNPDRDLF